MKTSDRSAAPGMAWPLAIWLGVQLLALAAGVSGVQVSAREPSPPQAWAAGEMIVTQLLAAALLGPILFASGRRCVVTLFTALPFLLTACYVAAVAPADAWRAVAITAGWLLAMAGISTVSGSMQVAARLLIVLATVGDVGLNYLRSEWTTLPSRPIGPITMSVSSLYDAPSWSAMWVIGGTLVLAVGLGGWNQIQKSAATAR